MYVDFTDVFSNLIKLVGTLALPLLVLLVQRWVVAYESVAKSRFITLKRQQVHGAADAAAGQLIVQLARGAILINQVRMGSPEVTEAARQAMHVVPDAVEALTLDREDLERMIIGKIGGLIPADPTVQTLLNAPRHDTADHQTADHQTAVDHPDHLYHDEE